MVQIIIRIVINAVALWVADALLDGLTLTDSTGELILVAIVFGVVNAFIKPIVQILSCPLTILTLGLFTLVINALMLMLTGWLTGGAVTTSNFWWALVGAVIISIVSTVLSWFLVEKS
jgi:putative membrane protein